MGVIVFVVLLFLMLSSYCFGQEEKESTYIVHVRKDMKPSRFATQREWYSSTLFSIKAVSLPSLESSSSGIEDSADSGILYEYEHVFHGFAATMTASQVEALTGYPGFRSVLPDTAHQLHTTRTPHFLDLDGSWSSPNNNIWGASNKGNGVIVGVLDTGIWPEQPSFSDDGLGPVPDHWKGTCQSGTAFSSRSCNRKIIGARYFSKGYESSLEGPIDETLEFRSPRDEEGHGTHTSSTTAGGFVVNASLFGYASGVSAGMAPAAHLAIYKICWSSGCFDSDILAAFDAAVSDGVDIISLSVGGPPQDHYMDSIAIGAFGAMKYGILTSASAGNRGPFPSSVTNVAPWILTVAANTLDRDFPAIITLGDGSSHKGISLFAGPNCCQDTPLVYGGDVAVVGANGTYANLCLENTLNSTLVIGKIVVCDCGIGACVAKPTVVQQAGGVATIIVKVKKSGEELIGESYMAPAAQVDFKVGKAIKAYLNKNSHPTSSITLHGTIINVKPSPIMAAFSSRGPNSIVPEILKPDITAPGVNILAAWTGKLGPSSQPNDNRMVNFNILSGTSMSCPHISGLAALLKGLYPYWSPSSIKSALMTTSTLLDNIGGPILDSANGSPSNPFSHGAGHVSPQLAMNPGLVYDLGAQDYVDYLCSLKYTSSQLEVFTKGVYNCSTSYGTPGDLNYPSFSLVYYQGSLPTSYFAKYSRTLLNVGGVGKHAYRVDVVPPKGVKVIVEPSTLEFKKANQRLTYSVTFKANPIKSNNAFEASFGSLAWKHETRVVQSPIAFTWFIAQ